MVRAQPKHISIEAVIPPLRSSGGQKTSPPAESVRHQAKNGVPYLICNCGTHLLFPGGIVTRSCWNCGATMSMAEPSHNKLRPPENTVGSNQPRSPVSYFNGDFSGPHDGNCAAGMSGAEHGHPGLAHRRHENTIKALQPRSPVGYFVGGGNTALEENAAAGMAEASRPSSAMFLRPPPDSTVGYLPPRSPQPSYAVESSSLPQDAKFSPTLSMAEPSHMAGASRSPDEVVSYSPPRSPIIPSMNPTGEAVSALSEASRPSLGGLGTLGFGLFLVSLVANAALILWCFGIWQPESLSAATTAGAVLPAARGEFKDTDGDGIPDQDDFCPGLSKSSTGWVSGRATDFDGDGCEDGNEDLDRDNDGVKDVNDRCPNTPQRYGFVSNQVTDFDGDGCADGLEDKDDDGDGIINSEDDCPRSKLGAVSDAQGCSRAQQKQMADGVNMQHMSGTPLWMQQQQHQTLGMASCQAQATTTPPPPPEKEDDWQDYVWSWVMEFRAAWAEIIVGAMLSTGMQKVGEAAEGVRSRLPSPNSKPPSGTSFAMPQGNIPAEAQPPQRNQWIWLLQSMLLAVRRLSIRFVWFLVFFSVVHWGKKQHRSAKGP
mmetsp:Transcript_20138/g.36452  ORF Transcript_20138/g.36452 Transcript_20138/m.36452 type:complete len:599 (-) Transcript_20138:119-1915(-)